MNTELSALLEQIRLFVAQHAPPDTLTKGVPLAVIILVCGAGMCVLGAKLARWGMTAGFALAGGYFGSRFGGTVDLHPLVGGAIGATAIGTIGFLTFRLWAGVAAAVVVSSVAMGIFGYQRVVPHVAAYQGQVAPAVTEAEATFTLPTAEEQQSYLDRTPREWATGLWSFARTRDAQLQPHAQLLGAGAMLAGLLFGLLATRAALILACAAAGTAMVSGSVGALMGKFLPTLYEGLTNRPLIAASLVGSVLLSSMIMQTMITKNAKSPAPKPAPATS